jgi:hypothetical protein
MEKPGGCKFRYRRPTQFHIFCKQPTAITFYPRKAFTGCFMKKPIDTNTGHKSFENVVRNR